MPSEFARFALAIVLFLFMCCATIGVAAWPIGSSLCPGDAGADRAYGIVVFSAFLPVLPLAYLFIAFYVARRFPNLARTYLLVAAAAASPLALLLPDFVLENFYVDRASNCKVPAGRIVQGNTSHP